MIRENLEELKDTLESGSIAIDNYIRNLDESDVMKGGLFLTFHYMEYNEFERDVYMVYQLHLNNIGSNGNDIGSITFDSDFNIISENYQSGKPKDILIKAFNKIKAREI